MDFLNMIQTATKIEKLNENQLQRLDEKYLDSSGLIKVLPANQYDELLKEENKYWFYHHAIYGIPTQETIDFLKKATEGLKTIEIGAGNNVFGRALCVPQTDSYIQLDPSVKARVELMGQKITTPHSAVEKYEATEAIRKYRPECVIGSWITQKGDQTIKDSSPYGVKEEWMLRKIRRYILIGNRKVHSGKIIWKYPHEIIEEPWILSRSKFPQHNFIAVWDCDNIN